MLSADNNGTKLEKGMVIIVKKSRVGYGVLLVLAITCLAWAVVHFSSLPKNAPTSTEESAMGDLSNEDLYQKYLLPLVVSGMVYEPWESPNNIPPDAFMAFFAHLAYSKLDDSAYLPDKNKIDDYGNLLISTKVMEKLIQKYFDVEVDILRQSVHYRSDNNEYTIGGLGGLTSGKVTGWSRLGDTLSLDCQIYQDTTLLSSYTLLIALSSDDSFKYLSFT